MPWKVNKKKETDHKTNLKTDVKSQAEILNKLKNDIMKKKTLLNNLVKEERNLKQKINDATKSIGNLMLVKQHTDEKMSDLLLQNPQEPIVNNLRLVTTFSCIRWNVDNSDENVIQGYLSEKDQFKVIDFTKGDRSWFSISDELWNMMICD